ncbi:MAG TPA: hypothetical protein VIV11_30065 [Kofleriaceae bacterium]
MRLVWAIALLCGCGRIAFDPLGEVSAVDASATDGQGSGDASTTAPPGDICDDVIDLQAGVPLTSGSIAGAGNQYGNLCGSGPEVVLRFTAPVAGNRRIDLTPAFAGSLFTGSLCPPVTGNCSAFTSGILNQLNPQLAAGVNYFVLDRTSGSGTTFSIEVL